MSDTLREIERLNAETKRLCKGASFACGVAVGCMLLAAILPFLK